MTELKTKREDLAKASEFLNPKDREFANSLIQFFDSRHTWSEKQLYWVDTLTKRGIEAKPHGEQGQLPLGAAPNALQPPPVPEVVENLIRISQLFQKAREQGLKYPKIRLEAEDGTKVVLRYSSQAFGKNPWINITDQAPYGAGRRYFGKISLDGTFTKSWQATPAILKLINEMAKDPVGMAKLYGLKTSACCFCSRPLETSESVTVGYGPICAEKFGLPWGETVKSTYTCLTPEEDNVNTHTSGG